MGLETRIDARLWEAIQNSHESRNYTGAILDALYFLSNLIRERTGLESDGVALAGQAFGGKSPKLKVNKLQSESDWNVQRGVEQLLRGIYQGIRNPRSHEKHADTPQDAEAIILFTNYLVKTIDKSRSPFTKIAFLKRVFDPDFFEDERYAKLLVDEIPLKTRLEVFIDVYRQKETGDWKKLRCFATALLAKLREEDLPQVYEIVSEELKHTDSDYTIISILQIIPSNCWEHFEEIARLRIENKLIQSIKEGYVGSEGKCYRGILGTWVTRIGEHFLLKDQLIDCLLSKLQSSEGHQNYVFKFMFGYLKHLLDPPSKLAISVIASELKKGNKRFYDGLTHTMELYGPKSWKIPFKDLYENFVEAKPTPEDSADDIPF